MQNQDRKPEIWLADLSVLAMDSIDSLDDLAVDADADGCRMVSRLIQEWNDGINRFDQPGERIYCASGGGRVYGVCGLNRDPFAGDATIGRVRRLYVAAAFRKQGIASSLLRQLMADARMHFRALHLRTFDPVATAFYASLGFSKVAGNPECTQAISLD
jgi:N-acetylglutamate synthase-like GNAT family acetyltransferase